MTSRRDELVARVKKEREKRAFAKLLEASKPEELGQLLNDKTDEQLEEYLWEGKQHARTKRSRDYECENLVKKEHWDTIKASPELKQCLSAWMRDMKAWGADVRDDIIRLEAAVGAAPGEPGDPPPAPRE